MNFVPFLPVSRWAHALAALMIALWCPGLHAAGAAPDLDGDGIPNIVDPDVDNDGIPNALDRNIDGGIAKAGPYSGQYIGDHIENENPAEDDIDDDGLPDDSLAETDIDGDGRLDDSDLEDDIDGDNRKDDSSAERDIDGDGREDDSDEEDDIDGDGRDDDDPAEQDIDGDGRLDGGDSDIDGDGKANGAADEDDVDGDGRKNDDPEEHDHDGDGVDDRYDDDDNNDGTGDIDDPTHVGDADEGEVELDLTRLPDAPANSRVAAKYQRLATGTAKFKIEVDDLLAGDYEILLGGVSRGMLTVSGNGGHTSGEKVFKTTQSGSAVLLDFEVAGQVLVIRRDGVDYFSGTMPTVPDSTGIGGEGVIKVTLEATSLAPASAQVEADLEFTASGPDQLEVRLEGFSPGVYSLLVSDVSRSTVTITGSSATLKFKTSPGAGEEALNFLTIGQSITITQGGQPLFTGLLPTVPAP